MGFMINAQTNWPDVKRLRIAMRGNYHLFKIILNFNYVLTLACRVGADVAILISGSGIVGRENYQLMLDFTRQLVYGVNVNRKDSQIAVVIFSDDSQVRFYLNDFNNFILPSSSTFPRDYVYAQLHALNAISNEYPYALSFYSNCTNVY